MATTLGTDTIASVRKPLAAANARFAAAHPGEPERRQPVHTVYGGAQLFRRDTVPRMGRRALAVLETYAPGPDTLATALGWTGTAVEPLAPTIYERVVAKLEREPVEDFRIDFEDGYGNRPDDEEDAEAERCAQEAAQAHADGTLSAAWGIRIKPFSDELFARGVRTLDRFVSTLLATTGGELPPGFVVTLPKVTVPEQVTALCTLLGELERAHDLSPGALRMEMMVETPQSILDDSGRSHLPALVDAAAGRMDAAHFGTYDYTALCNITAAHQHMVHPACDFARHMMQVALAQRGLLLSDGATNVMPVGPHRPTEGQQLTADQERENREVVHRAWRLSHDHIRHSLEHAFYQGWDLHPAQLPVRYATVYAFFLEGLEAATLRLRAFMDKAAQATLLGDVFDDAATGQGLLNVFLRGISCGAISEAEALETGLTLDEIRSRSFLRILEGRREQQAAGQPA